MAAVSMSVTMMSAVTRLENTEICSTDPFWLSYAVLGSYQASKMHLEYTEYIVLLPAPFSLCVLSFFFNLNKQLSAYELK